MIGVSGGPASTVGPSSSSQPALVTTVTAVVAAVNAVATSDIVIAIGTTSLRAFTRGLRTLRAYHCTREPAKQTPNPTSGATSSAVFTRAFHAASIRSAV